MEDSPIEEWQFERVSAEWPRQWLYVLDSAGVVYSEAQNRFVGLDAAGVAAYRAFEAGASVEELRAVQDTDARETTADDGLEVIFALSRGIFPQEEAPESWPAFDSLGFPTPRSANIEFQGIPVLLEYPGGRLAPLCLDYFRSCAASARPPRCHLSARMDGEGPAIYVNGSMFLPLLREEQLGLGMMYAARSLLYAEGEFDLALHAAMVALGESGWLLSAPREHGKSTLAAYLVAQGFDLVTDEPALLHLDSGSVASLSLPVCLKEGSWPVLGATWPDLEKAPVHLRSDGVKIRLAHPPADRYSTGPRRLTQIVFSQYSPSAPAVLERLSPMQALSLLNEGGLLLAKNMARDTFEAFLRLVCLIPSYRLRYQSLEDAYRLLASLRRDESS